MSLDHACLLPRLCLGSAPPSGDAVAREGFQILLLCAAELQTATPEDFPGVDLWHCGFEDAPLSRETFAALESLAEAVVDEWSRGRSILITCALGLNRSALVAALAYRLLSGTTGAAAAQRVREVRPGALFNPSFARYLDELPAP